VANGTEKLFIQFPYAWSGPGGGAPMAPHVGVCLLERNGGQASLTPVAPKEVETFLRNGLGIARTMFGDGVDEALRRVAAGGGWKLKLTDNPVTPYLPTRCSRHSNSATGGSTSSAGEAPRLRRYLVHGDGYDPPHRPGDPEAASIWAGRPTA
jgi:hypothetical protein